MAGRSGSIRRLPDGARPGVFYANAYDIKARPIWGMESLFLHEAVPGHHYQIMLQRENEDLPRFRRFGVRWAMEGARACVMATPIKPSR